MATNSRISRCILAGGFFSAWALSPCAGADDPPTPPIFTHPIALDAVPQTRIDAAAAPAPSSGPVDPLFQLVAEGLPKFDPSLAGQPAASATGQSAPVIMEPFSVFDTRVLGLERPRDNLLGKIEGMQPLFRYAGKRISSEMTFVDLAQASNWRPFSLEPPPAVTLRFTLSW
jgi:hypothetical protein